jgi:16S rRNA (guanine(1405)-N(7))-methyltransferase
MPLPDDALDRLVQAVRGSARYGSVSEDFVRRIGAAELSKRRSLKEAIKATRNKLHQVGGAYLDAAQDYPRWLVALRDAAAQGDPALRGACRAVMARHASTRERLPILETFFAETLAGIAPVRSVLDVACGLNPLAIPWMPLAPGATYLACDIYRDMMDFVGAFLALLGVRGRAFVCDVIHEPPTEHVHLALILKTLPCLEQVDKSAGLRLLDAVRADYALVSFPARSLGGRDKGMIAHYEARLRDLLAGRHWPVQRFEFETELAFLVDRRGSSAAP